MHNYKFCYNEILLKFVSGFKVIPAYAKRFSTPMLQVIISSSQTAKITESYLKGE